MEALMPHVCWTVKIAGVSGTGKTTVMEGLKNSGEIDCEIVIYSQLLSEWGDQELADLKLAEKLVSSNGLVLMDEHLEFDNPNKTRNYLRENTRGLVLLDVPLRDLVMRINGDKLRNRIADPRYLSRNLQVSRTKAIQLAHETKTPLLVIPNLHGEQERSIAIIKAFVLTNSP
ncbi:MAG: hypothetical protein WDZ90_00800 [Candidatus Paceibacterota bacterium]